MIDVKNKNHIYLLVGRSGSGKSSIADYLEEKYEWKILQSYTTRLPRYEGERGHLFISPQEFNKLKNKCAYTFFAGCEYCATVGQVEDSDLYIIDPAGIEYFAKTYKGTKEPICIILDLSTQLAEKHLSNRKGASPEETIKRLEHDEEAFKGLKEKQYRLGMETIVIDTDHMSINEIGDLIECISERQGT